MLKHFVILFSFILSSCSYFSNGQVEFLLLENSTPLQEEELKLTEINLYGKNNKNQSFSQNIFPNKQGQFLTEVDFSKYKLLKVTVINHSLEKIRLPLITYVNAPYFWQDPNMKIKINLKSPLKISKSATVPLKNSEKKEPLLVEPLPAKTVSISQIETPLFESIPLKTQFKFQNFMDQSFPINNISKKNSVILTKEKSITDKINYMKTTYIKIMNLNKPVANAQIYLGYNVSQILKKEGQTNALGEIKIDYNKVTAPNTIIVRKKDYVTVVNPFVENHSNIPYTIDLKNGESQDFLVQTYAYGLPRGMSKSEIYLNHVKQDISSDIGFVSLAQKLKPEDTLTVKQSDEQKISFLGKEIKNFTQAEGEIVNIYFSGKEPFKPTVGLLEPKLNGSLESNLIWRKARREFFSRFINEQRFKTKIEDDLLKILNVKNKSVFDQYKRGWQKENFAKDVDILLQIELTENEESPALVGRIYSKDGLIQKEQKNSLGPQNAPQVATQVYNSLMEELPLEAYVVGEKDGVFSFNLGSKHGVKVGDIFAAYISKKIYGPPVELAGGLKIVKVEEGQSYAKSFSGEDKIKNNLNVLLVRSSKNYIENEMKKDVSFNEIKQDKE